MANYYKWYMHIWIFNAIRNKFEIKVGLKIQVELFLSRKYIDIYCQNFIFILFYNNLFTEIIVVFFFFSRISYLYPCFHFIPHFFPIENLNLKIDFITLLFDNFIFETIEIKILIELTKHFIYCWYNILIKINSVRVYFFN